MIDTSCCTYSLQWIISSIILQRFLVCIGILNRTGTLEAIEIPKVTLVHRHVAKIFSRIGSLGFC